MALSMEATMRDMSAPSGSSSTRTRLRRQTATRKAQADAAADPVSVTREQIAIRAYEIYISRQSAEEGAMSDWLQAERELQILAAAARPDSASSLGATSRESRVSS
jgi:hypothetical protein